MGELGGPFNEPLHLLHPPYIIIYIITRHLCEIETHDQKLEGMQDAPVKLTFRYAFESPKPSPGCVVSSILTHTTGLGSIKVSEIAKVRRKFQNIIKPDAHVCIQNGATISWPCLIGWAFLRTGHRNTMSQQISEGILLQTS